MTSIPKWLVISFAKKIIATVCRRSISSRRAERKIQYWLRAWALPGAGFVAVLAARAPAAPPDTEPPAFSVELPTYVVVGKPEIPPPEYWRYAEYSGFVILSNASDRETQRLLGDFELFRHAVSIVWPIRERASVPLSIIVCGARNSFDAFVPADKWRGGTTEMLSMLLHDNEHGAIVIDAQTAVLTGGETTGNLSHHHSDLHGPVAEDQGGYEVDPANLLYREYIRFLLRQKERQLPVWMEEGMIQILLAMRVTREQIVFGKVENPRLADELESLYTTGSAAELDMWEPPPPAPDRDFNHVLSKRALLPLDDFFAVTRDSPEAGRILGENRWVKQAYALVHMCLFGRGGRYQKPFATFLQRASQAPVTEAMLKDCFGMDYKQMLLELQLYVGFTDHKSTEYYFKKGKELPAPTPLVLRDAPEWESGRIKGDALLLAGHRDAALAALYPPYRRGSRDPQLLATLGLYERAAGHDDRARKFLEVAVAGKVVRPEAYLELARLRHAAALAKPAAGTSFSAEQVTGITSLLYIGRHQPPHLSAIYKLLAETWRHSAAKIGRDDALVLIQGATLFPNDLELVYHTAISAIEANILDAARPLIDHGASHATTPQIKARFDQLKASLPALTDEGAKKNPSDER